jgi:hypothetical protein
MADTLTNGNVQDANLFRLEALLCWIELLADGAYCHVIHANAVTNHPTQLSRQLVSNNEVEKVFSPSFQFEIFVW